MSSKNRVSKSHNKRKFTPAQVLEPSEGELRKVREGLAEFYAANPQFLKDLSVEEKIEEVIDKAKKGWNCASKLFIKRVELITKWNSANIENLFGAQENYSNSVQVRVAKELKEAEPHLTPGLDASQLRGMLTGTEKKIWIQREKEYREEFEFNNSSDWPLLMQVLVEEIQQMRLSKKRLQDEDADLDIQMNESQKRMSGALKSLGLTREQREGAGKETDGNIAQLVMQYEEKEKLMIKKMKIEQAEEEVLSVRSDENKGLDILRNMGLDRMADEMQNAKHEEQNSDTLVSESDMTELDALEINFENQGEADNG